MQFVLLFGGPAYGADESFRELRANRYLNRLQTTITRSFEFRVQLTAQLNFFSLAAAASPTLGGLNQPDFLTVQKQVVDLVDLRQPTALFFQSVELDPHS